MSARRSKRTFQFCPPPERSKTVPHTAFPFMGISTREPGPAAFRSMPPQVTLNTAQLSYVWQFGDKASCMAPQSSISIFFFQEKFLAGYGCSDSHTWQRPSKPSASRSLACTFFTTFFHAASGSQDVLPSFFHSFWNVVFSVSRYILPSPCASAFTRASMSVALSSSSDIANLKHSSSTTPRISNLTSHPRRGGPPVESAGAELTNAEKSSVPFIFQSSAAGSQYITAPSSLLYKARPSWAPMRMNVPS
mmetsp:Transcript_26059/g.68975  ORF Transcript_26059/g.68975 Transcript_26059/m.68975 type:complete len:249 (+) Transcript_26059:193-939(+)